MSDPFQVQTDPDVLWDDLPTERKVKSGTQNVNLKLDRALLDLASHLCRDERLGFGRDLNAFVNAAVIALVDYYQAFLDADRNTMRHVLKEQQLRLTNERYAVHVGEMLEQQVENMRAWTADKEWGAVLASLDHWQEYVSRYPVRAWRSRAARMWLDNRGIRDLRAVWKDQMEPEQRQKMDAAFEFWERMV